MSKIIRAKSDILFFAEDDYFFPKQKLYPKQAEVLKEFYSKPYIELIMLKGMRGGGTFVASLVNLHDAFDILIRDDPATDYGFASHSTIYILAIAKSDDQAADTIFKQIVDKVRISPFFQEYRPRIRKYDITFRNKPDLEIIAGGAAGAGALAGRNVKSITFTEIAKYDETKSQRGAWQVYSILSKSTSSFKMAGHRIIESSPLHSRDVIMTLRGRADNNPTMLGYTIPTWEMNPNLPFDGPYLISEREKDPLTFWRDFGCVPFASYEAFYHEPEIVNIDPTLPNLLELHYRHFKGQIKTRPPVPQYTYILSGDPALRQDAFGLALCHRGQDEIIADGLWRFVPTKKKEIDPIELSNFLLYIVDTFPIRMFISDTWNYPETQEKIRRKGVMVVNHIVRKEDHDKVKEGFYLKKLRLCNYPFIRQEFENLRIINSRRVDHVKGGTKDVVDALTNGCYAIRDYLSVEVPQYNIIEVI